MYRTIKGNASSALPPLVPQQYSKSGMDADILTKNKKAKATAVKRTSLKQP